MTFQEVFDDVRNVDVVAANVQVSFVILQPKFATKIEN